ncbi:UBX domain-containing protein 4 [Tribolium madens]|uniref:UBX domain-containing protein 4 n=1 Tax=Tribolium madens TaxID=41895 RepID=UPI001CF71D1E|nr:UBX domain-containing protein 4 [Tribolium madens]
MNWFKGEIAQAIVTSKAKQAIFVVYVYGKDETSSQITELIDKEEIVKILGSDSFVAIKIETDSVPYQQFSQIYKQVPTPSIYFIGKQGLPIEIVTEVNGVKSFQEKLNSILQKGGLSTMSAQSQNFISNEQSQQPQTKPANVVCENDVCTIKKDEKPSTSQQAVKEAAKAEEKQDLTVEEKVERAKQLVEQKREEKRKEEFEKEREKELERRKMGQNVQQLKRWQDDQELKQVLEEREKEKRESQAARERVLAQIAQDKAERAAKFSPATNQPQSQPHSSQSSPKPVNTNTARLQFRMPDGRTATNDFASSDTLASVHAHIKANLHLPFNNYTLSTTFPRREFTEAENSQTLLQLGLVPTAVILILPVNRGVVATNAEGGFTGFLWTLITPILTLLGYLKTFVFGSAPAPSTNNDNHNKRAAESSSDHRAQPKVRRAGETTVIRRQGNIHRLSNKNDSDDENNTWNGNSTQQM